MAHQLVPQVSNDDIQRVVRREYSPECIAEVLQILSEYGGETWQVAPFRVRLAALKLANGNVEHLRLLINRGKIDYRDVIAPAENPLYFERMIGRAKLPEGERAQIIAADWAQYQGWLTR